MWGRTAPLVALLLLASICAPMMSYEAEAASSPVNVSMIVLDRNGTAPFEVDFNVLASSPFQPVTLSWDFGDGVTSDLWSPSHNYTAPGSYLAVVTATDSIGNTATDQTIIIVYPETEISISADVTSGTAPLTIKFNSTLNAEHDRILYTWTFGREGSSSSADPSFTFERPGTYYVVCKVMDDRGVETTSNQIVISVSPASVPSTGGDDAGDPPLPLWAIGAIALAAVAALGIVLTIFRQRPKAPGAGPGSCPHCGGPMSVGRFCPRCGKPR